MVTSDFRGFRWDEMALVEVRVDNGWVRGITHARRRLDGRLQFLVRYSLVGETVDEPRTDWFFSNDMRAT
jgi:hypothetical protein